MGKMDNRKAKLTFEDILGGYYDDGIDDNDVYDAAKAGIENIVILSTIKSIVDSTKLEDFEMVARIREILR